MDARGLTTLICVALLILETSVGVLASVYVIIIILLDFYKKKNMRTGNKIRVALSLSNVCFSIVTSANIFSGLYWSVMSRTTSANYVLYSFTMYCISSCSWLSASLSFFYFIKIVNVKTKCFIWVKTNISPIVSWVILVAEIVSFVSFMCVFFLIVPQPTSDNTTDSSLVVSLLVVSKLRLRFTYIIIVVTFVPLLTVVVTSITTAIVLTQHRLKMEQNMGPSANVKLETYKSAVYRMLRLLLVFTVFYIVMLIFYGPVFEELSPGFWVLLIIMSTFTPIQSILIVFGNPKLKRAWGEVTGCVRSCKG